MERDVRLSEIQEIINEKREKAGITPDMFSTAPKKTRKPIQKSSRRMLV